MFFSLSLTTSSTDPADKLTNYKSLLIFNT